MTSYYGAVVDIPVDNAGALLDKAGNGAAHVAQTEEESNDWRIFAIILGSFQVLLLILFGIVCEYSPITFSAENDIQYMFYLHVTIMMLVGFGFLMTFMRKYKLGAVGLTFMITAMCIPWCALTGRFFSSLSGIDRPWKKDYPIWLPDTGADETAATAYVGTGDRWPKVAIDVNAITQGNFAAAAVLISFGALIGKLTPAQTALLAILEVPLYSFNKEILAIGVCGTLDMGGTIFIHLFGAYFGLAAAWVIGKPSEKDADGAEPSHVSDILSLVGTVFLWLYWPSFNGATAPLGQNQQMLTTANTVIALCGSCMTSFVVSALINKRISTVDIQNATLAGGVAIGASSNLPVTPFFAMAVGVIAGTVSTCGFNKLQSKVEASLGIHDSCGVHNLHGMPALIGTIAVSIAVACKHVQKAASGQMMSAVMPDIHKSAACVTAGGQWSDGACWESTDIPEPMINTFPRGEHQAAGQIEGALLTLTTAVLGGLLVGWIVKKVVPNENTRFSDAPFWTVAGNFAKMD